MLDLISRGAQGHGPVHLLLISAAELGFCLGWRGKRLGSGFPPSPENDDWPCSALPLCYFGCLPLSSIFQAF